MTDDLTNCGLLTNTNTAVPLKSIDVDVQVEGHVATVTSKLLYVNEEENPLEALFVFPIPSEAALCHFSAIISDQEIVAELQERQQAREQYDDALSSGQQAFLLEESEESSDVFRMTVGALPPNQSATISFIYIIELSVQADDSLRFCLPAVLNPRYTPAGSGGGIVSEITSSVGGVPYTLSLNVHINSSNPITKVESKCSFEPLEFPNTDHTTAKVRLCAGHKFDRDVELFVFYQNPHQLSAIVEAGDPAAQPETLMSDPVVMLSFYPEFPKSVMSSCGEFVFLIDRSGSMDCHMHNNRGAKPRIQSARETLLLILKSLPMNCYFNIYGFGSDYESFFPKSVQYSQKNMEKALAEVEKIEANLGGTEILQPLKHIYGQPLIPEHPRQLFVFTDGEVGNTKEVLQCVRSNAKSHRCFSFGIGEGASTALIKGMAENGSGYAQFITGSDRMQAKVMQSLRFALQPAVTDVQEVWSGMSPTSLSPPIKSLFHGQRALIYAQLKGEMCQDPDAKGKISVQYKLGDQQVTDTAEFSLKPDESGRLTIHRLGARSLIRFLEEQEQDEGADKDALKNRMVELSVQCAVSSSHTTFIAIYKGSREPVKGPLVTRRVPTESQYELMCSQPPLCYYSLPVEECALRDLSLGSSLGSSFVFKSSKRSTKPKILSFFSRLSTPFTRTSSLFKKKTSACATDGESSPYIKRGNASASELAQCENEPMLQLISLQKAVGCWEMEPQLAEVFEKTEKELVEQIPAKVDSAVWATLLALIWFHEFKKDVQVEWQFVAMKAVEWIRTQNVSSLAECVKAGNTVLGCQVTEDTLGL